MPYFIFWPNKEDMKKSGYGAVAHVPCIFNITGEYSDATSRYLRERALLDWSPRKKTFKLAANPRYPTRISLRTFGDCLTNFLEWTEWRGLDWRDVRYTEDIINGYQEDMLSGAWSVSAEKLSAATVNLRVGEVCNFLSWAGERALRSPFLLITKIVQVTSKARWIANGKITHDVEMRVGRVRPDPKNFDIPADGMVQTWHKAVGIEKGYTKALICELIIKSGIRREEAVEWQIDTLPEDELLWRKTTTGDSVVVKVEYGAKGDKRLDEFGEEVGPARDITIPLSLARSIANYRTFRRPGIRSKYAQAANTPEEQKRRSREKERRLFLSEFTGEKISAQTIYNTWTTVTKRPFIGWSPHMGRHYWACKKLIDLLREDARRHGIKDTEPLPPWIFVNTESYINLYIQPQLGHVDPATTQDYLAWTQKMLSMADLQEAYTAELETIVSTHSYEGRIQV